jgi:hypothetical protein
MSGKAKKRPALGMEPVFKERLVALGALPGAGNSGQRLCWRFAHVDHDGPWGFSAADTEVFCAVLRKLAAFESMTVNELFHHGDEPGKEYELARLPNAEAVTRLEAAGLGDQTKIWRLRCKGTERLYGFLDGNIFHVVFWDPQHQIWPSTLRHT